MTRFSELPHALQVSILAKVPISQYRILALTSKAFGSLITSMELSNARSSERSKETQLYVCISLPNPIWCCLSKKPALTTKATGFWLTKVPIEDSHPISRTMLGVENCIYMIASTGSKSMLVLNCSLQKWSQTKRMIHARNYNALLLKYDDRIFVLGGTDDRFLHPEVYCPRTEVWEPLPEPELEKDATVVLINSCDGGKIEIWYIFRDGANKLTYNPAISTWKKGSSSVGRERGGSLTVVIGDLIIRIIDCQMIWYNKDTMLWKTIEGSGEFEEMPFQAIPYGTNMLAFWNVFSDGSKKMFGVPKSHLRETEMSLSGIYFGRIL